DQLDALINPIREALNIYDLGADPEVTPRPFDDLETHAEELCALVRATNIKQVAAELPALLHEATTAAHLSSSDRGWRLLASVDRPAYDVTSKLGYPDLCTVALDRLDWAAQRASDPLLGGMRQYLRA
nr:transcriptional regulator [Streptomyces sp. DSM 41633]